MPSYDYYFDQEMYEDFQRESEILEMSDENLVEEVEWFIYTDNKELNRQLMNYQENEWTELAKKIIDYYKGHQKLSDKQRRCLQSQYLNYCQEVG